MHYILHPQHVCATRIELDVIDGRVRNLAYTGGCNGNLKALSSLAEGMPAEELIHKLKGIRCGQRATSCGDQLATLLQRALEK